MPLHYVGDRAYPRDQKPGFFFELWVKIGGYLRNPVSCSKGAIASITKNGRSPVATLTVY
ncbi:MAG: hypothetical protein AB4352_28665 [Hormoscilla sp.]